MEKRSDEGALNATLKDTFQKLEGALSEHKPELRPEEVGIVTYVGSGIARVTRPLSRRSLRAGLQY